MVLYIKSYVKEEKINDKIIRKPKVPTIQGGNENKKNIKLFSEHYIDKCITNMAVLHTCDTVTVG